MIRVTINEITGLKRTHHSAHRAPESSVWDDPVDLAVQRAITRAYGSTASLRVDRGLTGRPGVTRYGSVTKPARGQPNVGNVIVGRVRVDIEQ